jgi:hypothetical protein
MEIPQQAGLDRIAFLPPMSGLAANETRLDPGAINVRLGEGRTAEVLRNLCYQIATSSEGAGNWRRLQSRISGLFKVELDDPEYVPERGEITMTYRDPAGIHLDVSASGRGLQQTLLLLAHLALNPRSVLLIDEPDAHLEILRQRQIYQMLSEAARERGSQVILASHSEVPRRRSNARSFIMSRINRGKLATTSTACERPRRIFRDSLYSIGSRKLSNPILIWNNGCGEGERSRTISASATP